MYRVLRGVAATGTAKRRQEDNRPELSEEEFSPEIERVVKQPTFSLYGEGRNGICNIGEDISLLPGFVPTACCQWAAWEQVD